VALETLGLLGVLGVEKTILVSFARLYDSNVGAKDELSMCMLASCRSLMERPALVGNDSKLGGDGGLVSVVAVMLACCGSLARVWRVVACDKLEGLSGSYL
jgi:hypothetical protein